MEFTQFYVVLLRKGPTWSPEVTPQVEATQEKHLAHLASLAESGALLLAGPTQVHSDNDLRGIGIYRYDAFETLDAVSYTHLGDLIPILLAVQADLQLGGMYSAFRR